STGTEYVRVWEPAAFCATTVNEAAAASASVVVPLRTPSGERVSQPGSALPASTSNVTGSVPVDARVWAKGSPAVAAGRAAVVMIGGVVTGSSRTCVPALTLSQSPDPSVSSPRTRAWDSMRPASWSPGVAVYATVRYALSPG